MFFLIPFFLQGWGVGGLGSPNVLSKLLMTFPFTTIRIKYGTQTVL